ncbi:MAG: response regulator [Sterolibacterium sp.]|nr:response regulator [Sterolibacterium sp.]
MSDPFKVFVVDDDAVVLEVIRAILEAEYAVETFESAEACQARLVEERPGMFLLDVNLPGMDGYSFCRQIKDDTLLNRIPVTFISGNDTIEARLAGYDAGGEDFIVKPFAPEEVLRKIKVAQQIVKSKRALEEQYESSEYLATLALASMDESGLVLQFMSKLIAMDTEQEIAEGLLELMQRYKLDGVVQTRVAQRTLTLSAAGANLPLETSVLNHVRGLERIFEFHNRSVHNFERVTLMVNNMPLSDPDFCGRLRDNLSVAAQGADSRLQAIETTEVKNRSQAGILSALESLRTSLGNLREDYLRDRAASAQLMLRLEEDMANAFVHLGLTTGQEETLENLVQDFMQKLVALLDRGEETQAALQKLSDRLGQLQ